MDRLNRALAYPYERPAGSFLMTVNAGIQPFKMIDTHNRAPVIVAGSNAAPSRLADKYRDCRQAAIPVQDALLHDYSPVYSCHFSAYGSVHATMEYDPGSHSRIHVVWLTAEQLDLMHETESLGENYRYAMLEKITLVLAGGQKLENCSAYLSLKGALLKDGRPVRLAAFETQGSNFQSLSQTEIQNYCCSVLAPQKSLQQFMMENIDDAAMRRDRINQLRHYAGEPSCPSARTVKN